MSVREALRRSARANRARVNGTGVVYSEGLACMAYEDRNGDLWASVWTSGTLQTLYHGRFYRAMEVFDGR